MGDTEGKLLIGTPRLSPKDAEGREGLERRSALHFGVSNAQRDVDGEHRLVCPAVNTETISFSQDPSSSKMKPNFSVISQKKQRKRSFVRSESHLEASGRVLNPSHLWTLFLSQSFFSFFFAQRALQGKDSHAPRYRLFVWLDSPAFTYCFQWLGC